MKLSTRKIALCGVIAGLYAAITLLMSSFAYGPVQFRIAEALAMLCCFEPTMVIGITLGCFISNIFSTVTALDMVVGTAATLLACLTMVKIKNAWLAVLPNVLFNSVFIGALIAATTAPGAFAKMFWISSVQVAVGELVVMVVLGVPLFHHLKKGDFLEKMLGK